MDFDAIRIDSVQSLSAAAAIGNVDLLRRFIAEKREDPQDNRGWRAIHHAVQHKQVDCVELLLSYEISDVNWESFEGYTPLHLGVLSSDISTLRSLLSSPAVDINSLNSLKGSCLHMVLDLQSQAVGLEMLKALIERGADVNLKDGHGRTPLHLTVEVEYFMEFSEILLRTGADLLLQDFSGRTALMMATSCRNVPAVRLLLSIPDSDLRTKMVNMVSNFDHTALFFAVLTNSLDCVKILCEAGADADDIEANVGSPLVCFAIEEDENPSPQIVRTLLQHMDLKKIGRQAISSMYYFAGQSNDKRDILKVLFDFKIDLNKFGGDKSYLFPKYMQSIGDRGGDNMGFLSYYLLVCPFEGSFDKCIFEHIFAHMRPRENEILHPLVALSLNAKAGEPPTKFLHYIFEKSALLSERDIMMITLFGEFSSKLFLLRKHIISPNSIMKSLMSLFDSFYESECSQQWKNNDVASLLMNVFIVICTLGEAGFVDLILNSSFFRTTNAMHLFAPHTHLWSTPKTLKQCCRNYILKNGIVYDVKSIPEACQDLIQYSDLSDKELRQMSTYLKNSL